MHKYELKLYDVSSIIQVISGVLFCIKIARCAAEDLLSEGGSLRRILLRVG